MDNSHDNHVVASKGDNLGTALGIDIYSYPISHGQYPRKPCRGLQTSLRRFKGDNLGTDLGMEIYSYPFPMENSH